MSLAGTVVPMAAGLSPQQVRHEEHASTVWEPVARPVPLVERP